MDNDKSTPVQEFELPPSLRFLRQLVTVLTGVMIVGVVLIIALLVIRLNSDPAPALPASITLPDGSTPVAFTQTADWYAIVTTDNKILIYSLDGALRDTLNVTLSD
jgi:hypothetical protein